MSRHGGHGVWRLVVVMLRAAAAVNLVGSMGKGTPLGLHSTTVCSRVAADV